jgi:hypothetical protein
VTTARRGACQNFFSRHVMLKKSGTTDERERVRAGRQKKLAMMHAVAIACVLKHLS